MKSFLCKLWSAINSPIVYFIVGYILLFIVIITCHYYSELKVPCVVAFVSGSIMTIGFECVEYGFARRKSSEKSDDNK